MTCLKPMVGLSFISLILLSGCLFAPQDIQYYDAKCKIMMRKKTLTSAQMQTINQCRGDACALVLAGAGLVSAASLVLSGTIVIAANTVSWLESVQGCPKHPTATSDSGERQADLDT
ncbi:hypothetical protein [Pseudoalteromonas sp. OOF1S-7]|uniref:hypothetical protein n=1 Tax=Pseudoalteromonas sp. OOF1S-7 TaxID=2917757 RepID=UPI001EF482A7|nr:hypothetical protein [Pseudoalteromonas sp. OOF1S-7]MCG7534250.1 hypothetical protein [Pseudoalteromonas sp. OOF1S-7]